MQAVLGQKVQQSQRFLEDGTRVPVTVVSVADNPVVGVRTQEKNGYTAVQLGYGSAKKPSKSVQGIAKKANLTTTPKVFREVRTDEALPEIGDLIKVTDIFKPGDIIQVTGMSKGKGWAGGVKRYGFRGGPRTHGQSDRERAPGSIGQTTTPGRVYKGKRMAGRMGHEQVTVKNLKVVAVDGNSMLIAGLVPGPANNMLLIQKIGEDKKFTPLFSMKEPEPETPVAPDTTEAAPIEAPQAEESVETPVEEVSPKAEATATEEKTEEVVTPADADTASQEEAPVASDAAAEATDASVDSSDEKKEEEKDAK